MDLFWLLLLAIGGMIVLAASINYSRDSILGQQNTFLFLEAIIVGMFVFLTVAMGIILYLMSKNKQPDVSIREVRDLSILNKPTDLLKEESPSNIRDN